MSKVYLIFIMVFSTLTSYTQRVYALVGMAMTSPKFDYHEAGKEFATNVYSIVGYTPAISLGIDIFEKDIFKLGAMLHYNQISGTVPDNNVGRVAMNFNGLKNTFSMQQISLSPIVTITPLKYKNVSLGLFLGPKVDYILSVDPFINLPNKQHIQDMYNAQRKNIVMSSIAGINLNYAINKDLSIIASGSYIYPMSDIINYQKFILYTYTNPPRTDYIESSNIRQRVEFFQAQLGVSYKLSFQNNHLKTQTP